VERVKGGVGEFAPMVGGPWYLSFTKKRRRRRSITRPGMQKKAKEKKQNTTRAFSFVEQWAANDKKLMGKTALLWGKSRTEGGHE